MSAAATAPPGAMRAVPGGALVIGRYTSVGVVAEIGGRRLASLGAAGVLVVAAAAATRLQAPAWTLALSLAALCLTGFPIVWRAARGILRLQTNVDELVSLAIVASLLMGEWLSASVVAFIMVAGALIEEFVSTRSRRHLEALFAATPHEAIVLEPDGTTRPVAVSALSPGARILVRPGDVVAADGTVMEGESTVDESLLTG